MIPITPRIALDETELLFDFIRASGPGGQNVNKVATAVRLHFDLRNSPSLPPAVRERLARLAGKRLSADGILTILARAARTQEANRQAAIERLVALIREAAVPPTPRTPTKPTIASQRRRLDAKRRQSQRKRDRQSRPDHPD
jgi:ribosome-associated protein